MHLAIVAAMAKNRVIGYQQQLPWRLPADLQHFKKTTLGKPIIMGRNTHASIGRALPGRQNIVVTRQRDAQFNGCETAHPLTDAIALGKGAEEIMIIGGGQLYTEALPLVDRLYLTFIEAELTGDCYFPEWDAADWQLTRQQRHQADEQNIYDYSFVQYDRTL